jgi:K+-transporting ATPase c subunit
LVTVISQALFQDKAEGSVVSESGVVRGSSLLGVPLDHPENYPGYFWGRPSAASVDDATTVLVSGANNLGATSPALHDEVARRFARTHPRTPCRLTS